MNQKATALLEDQGTTPPKLRDIARIKSDALTATTSAPDVELIVEYPPVHEISLPPASPPGPPHVTAASASASVIEDCPNRSLYSNISRQLAQGKSSDSEDDADDGGHFTPDGEPPPERRTSEPSTAVAAGGDNANGDDTDSEDEAPVKASPNKVPADDKSEEKEDGEAFNDSGTTLNSELNDENHSDFGSLPEDDRVPRSNGVVNGSQETATKSAKRSKISNGDGETEAEIELGCEEDKDGLVDITDDEISNYERRWELEEDNRSQAGGASKTVGLEGLETEAISDCEYNEVEEKIGESSPKESHENGSKEEGEIVVEERPPPVAWKKLSKGTKERSYRDKDTKDKTRKKESKKKEKKKEIERYDVRKLISEKPRRKVDEFGRDLSSKSRSRSRTRSRSPSLKRSLSRGKRKRSVSRPRVGRAASKTRGRLRSKSRGRSRDRSKENKSKRRSRSRSRSRRKSRSRSRKKQRSKSPVPAKKKEKPRERGRPKSKEKRPKRRAKSSASCSSCSCSSCEREKRRSRKLTVTVPNKQTRETAQERAPSKEKRKSRPRYKEGKRSNVGAPLAADGGGGGRGGGSPKRRRLDSPAPSKEVFTSGDNILVSVNFKASKSGEGSRSKDSSKKRRDDDGRKKKDKGTKENQPVRTVSGKGSGRKKLNTKNMKPVAIIDLVNASPFREQTLSPKEVIILTDSDSEEKNKEVEIEIPMLITGPKTPPEPHIKFNLVNSKQQQLRNMSNPLLDSSLEQTEGEGDDEATEIIHKGPNTPPEPPVPYDPFEPTKSRSPTPNPDQTPDRREPSPVAEIDLCPSLTPPQPQPPLTPPKIAQHESPKTPSPLHTPPVSKTTEESGGTGGGSGPIMIMMVDKPKPPPTSLSTSSFIQTTTTTLTVDSEDDSVDMIGGGDSPYSPGSAEGDDLFEPPLPINATTTTTTPKGKPTNTTTSTTTISSSSSVSVPRPIPLANNKHTPLKLTPSPLKKRPSQTKQNSTPIKAGRANSKREIGIKLDEDQLKILDELPNSAVEMQVKDKFLKKLNRQERVVEEVKLVLKPHYAKKHITKEDYKEILRKAVPKICHSKSGEINPAKIQRLIEAYVKKYRHKTKRKTIPPIQTVQSLRNNKQKTMWA